ncbi:hypothetical protein PpBr36_06970 [Pyricularia pennisetigena]|uniref:hypothetical protein n=1 Tax=Pyricularia pennisetigena TaxID=1578925 RepID=UPI001151D9F8|nr:hypothetical protein PpBr36_06970 [Pyricularia pennisetigena]TLS25646.1 hypothetical protein PpBr36_06970 [Pyricularia pennisetigena]
MISKKAPRTAESNAAMLSTIHELDGSEEGFVSESYHRPEDVLYVGSDDEYYESSAQRTERCRAKFEAYIQRGSQHPPLIMSASLKGPFDSKNWVNPWRSRSQRTVTAGAMKQAKVKSKTHPPRQHLSATKLNAMPAADPTYLDTPIDINPAPMDQRKMKQIETTVSWLPSVGMVSESTAKEHAPTILPVTDTNGLSNPFNPKKRVKQSAVDWLRRPSPIKKRKPGLAEQQEPPPSSPSEQVATKRKRTSDNRASLPIATDNASGGIPRSHSTHTIQPYDKLRLSVSSGIIIDESTMRDESSFTGATLPPFQDSNSPSASSTPEQEAATSGNKPCTAPIVIGLLSSTHKCKKTYNSEPACRSPDTTATYSSSPLSSIDSSKIFETQQDESFCFKAKVRQANNIGNKGEQSAAQTHNTEVSPAPRGSMDGKNDEIESVSQGSGKSPIKNQIRDAIPEPGNGDELKIACRSNHVINDNKDHDGTDDDGDDDGDSDDETTAVQDAPLHFSTIRTRLTTQGHCRAEPNGNGSPIHARLSEAKAACVTSSPRSASQTLLSSQLNVLQSQLKSKCSSQRDTNFAAGDNSINPQDGSKKESHRPSAIADTSTGQESESTTGFEADETTLVQGCVSGVPELSSQLKAGRGAMGDSLAGSQKYFWSKKAGEGISQSPGYPQDPSGSPSTYSQSVSLDHSRVTGIVNSGSVSLSQPLTALSTRWESAVSSTMTRRPASQPLQRDMTLPLSSLRAIAQSSLNMYFGSALDREVTTASLPDLAPTMQTVEETKSEALTPEGLPKSPVRPSRCTSSPSGQLSIIDGSTDESEDDSDVNAEDQPIHDTTEIRDCATQKTPRPAEDMEGSPKLATQDQSPWELPEDGLLRTSLPVNMDNNSFFLSQSMRSSPPLPRIHLSFSDRRTSSQMNPPPVAQSPWAGEDMATPRVRRGQAVVSPLSLGHCTNSQEVPNPALPSFADTRKSEEPDHNNLQPTAVSVSCRPSTPEGKLSSLPTPELTFSLKPFRRFLSPSPRSERRKSRHTPNRALCTQDILSVNPWAQEYRTAKRVRWAPLPGSEGSAEADEGPVVAALSPSASEEIDNESDSSSSDDAAGDDEDEDYIEAGLSRSVRSRNVRRAKKTAAAVLASSVKPHSIPTRPYSPPPPTRTFVDDLPSEVTLFQNHFAKVDSERKMFKPKTLKRPLANDTDPVQQSPSGGSQPVDAVARRFAEADAASVRPAAKRPRSSIFSKPISSPRHTEQSEENERPVDDVSAVINNLGDFLGGWDVDVELTQSAREREQNEAQSNYMSLNMGISPWA